MRESSSRNQKIDAGDIIPTSWAQAAPTKLDNEDEG